MVGDFYKIKIEINVALCDSVDTRTVIEKLRELIGIGNAYINEMVSGFIGFASRWYLKAFCNDIN